jgi:molybdopterin-guanine dinucleotide biosynthesis protein A
MRQVADSQVKSVDAVFAEQPDGRIQPLCGLYRRDSCLPEIEKMLSDGDWRLQQLRERLNPRIIRSSEIEDIRGA